MLAYDRRSEPRVGERVPYVIVCGMPGLPLIQLVRRPIEVLQDPNLRLNATYYITKQILPPLARVFSLIGIDVFSWYHELPRVSAWKQTDYNHNASIWCLLLSCLLMEWGLYEVIAKVIYCTRQCLMPKHADFLDLLCDVGFFSLSKSIFCANPSVQGWSLRHFPVFWPLIVES